MDNVWQDIYDVTRVRKQQPQAGSYTCYLFEKGLDKILKKVGEETAETIIAAKNQDNQQTVMELADLVYHLFVLMAAQDIPLSALTEELRIRREKIGNLKPIKQTDIQT